MRNLILIRRTRLEVLRLVLARMVSDLEEGYDPQVVALHGKTALACDDQRTAEEIP